MSGTILLMQPWYMYIVYACVYVHVHVHDNILNTNRRPSNEIGN